MEHRDLLQTIAEVAAAFAGFSGVISVFGRLGDSDEEVSQRGARSIIEASLFTILFAFLPLIVEGFGVPAPTTWRISSGAFLVLLIAGAFGGTRRLWGVGTGGASFSRWSPFLAVMLLVGLAMIVLLATNVIGLPLGPPATIYVLCLLGTLAVAGLTFLQLVVRASRS